MLVPSCFAGGTARTLQGRLESLDRLHNLVYKFVPRSAQENATRENEPKKKKKKRTCDLGVFRLKFIALVCAIPRVAMDHDAERGRGRLARLAREEAIDVIRRCLAVVENRFGGLVRRRHNL
jgi:hypothetical protein